jgi:hypothetical protein
MYACIADRRFHSEDLYEGRSHYVMPALFKDGNMPGFHSSDPRSQLERLEHW